MAFAVFSDIHGNLEALEAIINHAHKKAKIKDLYFLGDAITFGPDSNACLKLLEKNKVKCVAGNHEQRIVRYDKAVKSMTYATTEHMNYVFSSLDRESLRFIKSMPVDIKINYKGHNIFFTHYIHDKNGIIKDDYEEFTEPRLRKVFEYSDSDVVFFGHIHKRKVLINEEGESYVCTGASGCVKGDRTFYTKFDIHKDFGDVNYDIDRINVPFNRKRFDEKMKNTPLPDKQNYGPHVFGGNKLDVK
ncbi:MAG: metallophosphoesterase [Christensenellaceae bacterium]|nr:metallophosphoesterase [Christensenellaceae bacterium]